MNDKEIYFDNEIRDKDTLEYLKFDKNNNVWKLYVNETENKGV